MYKLRQYCLTRLCRFMRAVFRTFMIVQRFRCTAVIDVARRWKRSGKGAAQDSKCRGEVRLHTLRCRGVVRGTGGQAISQLQRQSLSSREYIDTSEAHWPVYNIAYRYVRAPTFRPSRTSSREKHRSKMIPHRSLDRPQKLSELLGVGFLIRCNITV